MALPSDLIELLAEFADAKVDYLLVGGQAVALHGFPRFTKDADLWLRDDPVGREALILLKRASGRPQDLVDAQNLEAQND